MQLGLSDDQANTLSSRKELYLRSAKKQQQAVSERKQVVITFLGLTSYTDSLDRIRKKLRRQGYICLEASPRDTSLYSFSSSEASGFVESNLHKSLGMHIGITSIKEQAKAAEKQVKELIKQENIDPQKDEIILLGHSQGGVIATMFWSLFREAYNLKGLVTVASPLQGVELIPALRSLGRQQEVAKEANFVPHLGAFLGECLWQLWIKTGLCQGITDLAPDSQLIKQELPQVWGEMSDQQFPALFIRSGRLENSTYFGLLLKAYGHDGLKRLLGGKRVDHILRSLRRDANQTEEHQSDGLIAIRDQVPFFTWNEAKIRECVGDHGMSPDEAHPRVCDIDYVLDDVAEFCKEVFSEVPGPKSRKHNFRGLLNYWKIKGASSSEETR